MTLDKQHVFTLQTAHGYTKFTEYCADVGYEPYLHDDKPSCIHDNLDVFSRPVVTHSAIILPQHPSMTPEG